MLKIALRIGFNNTQQKGDFIDHKNFVRCDYRKFIFVILRCD
jgi:hypothetical protein